MSNTTGTNIQSSRPAKDLPTQRAEEMVEVLAPFRLLLEQGGRGQAPTTINEVLGGLKAKIETIIHEQQGMADDLLRAYEQLGVVFELTSRQHLLQNEDEVISLLVQGLKHSFVSDEVSVVTYDSDDQPHITLDDPGNLEAILQSAREHGRTHSVTVHSYANADGGPQSSIIVAPVFAGEEFAFAIALARPADAGTFDSGDMLLVDSLAKFCGDVIRNLRLMNEVKQVSFDLVKSLVNAVEQKDEYTSGHSQRVGSYAMLLGRELGLSEEELQTLHWSALLHDLGKIGIRDDVLKKPGKLTNEEFEHIKEHPVRSYQVVKGISQLSDALPGVLHHHERWDGKGYPDGLKGEEIPLQARIVQTADVFDALTSCRSYRVAYDWERALEIIEEEAGTTLDAKLAKAFTNMLRRIHSEDPSRFAELFERHSCAGAAAS